MGVINQLSSDISNKIAAGEVVERPASVVKELVENAIDAGAKVITVEIEHGGASFIRVSDNGCGMEEEDARLCFLRHATSKIKTAEDLDAIYTLGFRGEALSSIGAVSRVEIFTKRPQDELGTKAAFCGGELMLCEPAGAADGTTIVVRDLFFNTPARMKFLKKDSTEAGYVADIMTRFILSHPEISFRFTKDGTEQYFTPGDNSLKNALYAVYGREYAKAVIDVDYEMESVHVTGVAGKGETARANRGYQSYFVNGRYIKSPVITRAVEDAYKNQIMIGKFPMAVLNIEINPQNIDINVHPTKLEVKFSNDQDVYRAVYHAVKNAIYSLPHIPQIERSEKEEEKTPKEPVLPKEAENWEKAPMPRGGFAGYERRAENKDSAKVIQKGFYNKDFGENNAERDFPKKTCTKKAEESNYLEKQTYTQKEDQESVHKKYTPASDNEYFLHKQEKLSGINTRLGELKSQQEQLSGIETMPRQFMIIGQLFKTYILVEEDESLLLIDQHAAHERIKYEQLKVELSKRKITPQTLIIPVPVDLTPLEMQIFLDNREKLSYLGFEAEEKDGKVRLTAVPSVMDEGEMCRVFVELITAIGDGHEEVIDNTKQRLIYTIACKAAVKANQRFTEMEMYDLVRQVFEMDNINTCPHGRPIIIKMTKKEIEKEFGRII